MNLLPETGVEVVFMIIGLLVGVCYGFDGYFGSTKDGDLRKSGRLKNLTYVIGGLFLVFIADLKKLGIADEAARPRLLQNYIEGVAVAVVLVVGVVSICIFLKYRHVRKTNLGEFIPQDFNPAMEYVFYGFNYYRTTTREILQKAEEDRNYIGAYVGQISKAIAAVSVYTARPTDDVRKLVAQQILQSIRAVVMAYYGTKDDSQVNVNCMVAYQVTPGTLPPRFKTHLRYAAKAAEEYAEFLSLEVYAEDREDNEDFVLPVEPETESGWETRLLPGAPEAFKNKGTVVIDDTQKMKFPSGVSRQIVADSKKYFAKKSFKSFASMNMIFAGSSRGIVNVESTKACVFGKDDDQKQQVESFLKPFCSLLGFLFYK